MLSARLAPIYDSGTSLGHNLLDEKMERMLNEKSKESSSSISPTTGPKATAALRFERGGVMRHDQLLQLVGHHSPEALVPAGPSHCHCFQGIGLVAAWIVALKQWTTLLMAEAAKMRSATGQELIPPAYVLSPVRKAFIRELLYLRHQELCKLREQIRA